MGITCSRCGLEDMGVTRSKQMRKYMQKHWEPAKPQRDGMLASSSSSLTWENTIHSCCDVSGICRGLSFLSELKVFSKNDFFMGLRFGSDDSA